MADRLTLTGEGDIVTRAQKYPGQYNTQEETIAEQEEEEEEGEEGDEEEEEEEDVLKPGTASSQPRSGTSGSAGNPVGDSSRPGTSGSKGIQAVGDSSRPGTSGTKPASQGSRSQGNSRPGTSGSKGYRSQGNSEPGTSSNSGNSRPGTSGSQNRPGTSGSGKRSHDGWQFVPGFEPGESPDDIEATDPNIEGMKVECADLRGVAVTTAGRIKSCLPPREEWLPNFEPGFGTWIRSIPDFEPNEQIQVKLNAEREIWKKAIITEKRADGLYNIKIGERIFEKIPKERIKPQDMTIPPSVLRFSWLSVEDMFNKGWWLGLSGGADGSVKVWNLKNQECIGTCLGHDGPVHTIDCDFVRRRALTGGGDGVLRVWDIENCEQVYALFGHSRAVLAARADFFRLKAVSSSADCTVKIWDLAAKNCICTLKGHQQSIPVCLVDFVRQAALSCSWDGQLRLWDLKRQYCRQLLSGHTDRVHCVSADFKVGRALSGSEDGNLILWDFVLDFKDVEKRLKTADMESDDDEPDGVVGTPESEDFQGDQASVSSDEPEDRGRDTTEAGQAGGVDEQHPPSTPSEKSSDYYIVPQTPCARILSTLVGHKDSVTTLCVDFKTGRALSGSDDETLRFWEIPKGSDQKDAFTEEETLPPEGEEGDIERNPARGPVTCRCLATLRGHTLPVTVVRADFRRHIAVSGSDDMSVRVWDLKARKLQRSFTAGLDAHSGFINAIVADFPRFRVITASSDLTLRLWNVENLHADGMPMVGHVQKVTCIFTNTLVDDLDEEEKEREKEKRKAEQKRLAALENASVPQGSPDSVPQPQAS